MESDLTDENIAEAMKEAPVWAKMFFSQMMNVNYEIANVRRQVDYLKLDMDNKIQTMVGNTEKINDEVKSLEAMKEAPVWAKMFFSQMMNVNYEIANVRRQVDYLKLHMDNKIQTMVGNTEKINDEVKSLESKVETLAEEKNLLKRKVDKLMEDLDEMEQYSGRSCLIFVGIKETGDIPEDTDKEILDVCNNKLGLNLTQEAIDRSYRVGPVHEARS